MTRARVDLDAAFKKCCMRSGRYDGAKRNHFFPRIAERRASLGQFTLVIFRAEPVLGARAPESALEQQGGSP
jgi:hypothetical protein